MKRDSQNSDAAKELPQDPDGTAPEHTNEAGNISYYYDDATGYEVYRQPEDEDENGENSE